MGSDRRFTRGRHLSRISPPRPARPQTRLGKPERKTEPPSTKARPSLSFLALHSGPLAPSALNVPPQLRLRSRRDTKKAPSSRATTSSPRQLSRIRFAPEPVVLGSCSSAVFVGRVGGTANTVLPERSFEVVATASNKAASSVAGPSASATPSEAMVVGVSARDAGARRIALGVPTSSLPSLSLRADLRYNLGVPGSPSSRSLPWDSPASSSPRAPKRARTSDGSSSHTLTPSAPMRKAGRCVGCRCGLNQPGNCGKFGRSSWAAER